MTQNACKLSEIGVTVLLRFEAVVTVVTDQQPPALSEVS